MASEEVAGARKLADENRALGLFAIDLMLAAGPALLAAQARLSDPEAVPNEDRYLAVSRGLWRLHKAMAAQREDPKGVPSRDIWRACVELAAAAALLATEGDAAWPYDPKEGARA